MKNGKFSVTVILKFVVRIRKLKVRKFESGHDLYRMSSSSLSTHCPVVSSYQLKVLRARKKTLKKLRKLMTQ